MFEGAEWIELLIARQASTKEHIQLRFEDAWARGMSLPYTPTMPLLVPSIEDMILDEAVVAAHPSLSLNGTCNTKHRQLQRLASER